MFLIAAPILVSALEHSPNFIGLGTEVTLSLEPEIEFGQRIDRISQVFTYGPRQIRPIRIRIGAGWYHKREFALFTGLELPVYEKLNKAQARSFGLYLVGDMGVSFLEQASFEYQASAIAVITVTPLGGIGIGAVIDKTGTVSLRVAYWAGLYPLIIPNKKKAPG